MTDNGSPGFRRVATVGFLVLVLFLQACGDGVFGRADAPGVVYLEEVVPPCVPTESEPDPCPVGLPVPVDMVSPLGSIRIWNHVPSFVAVKEYIVGEGPPKLTVIMHRENVYEEELDSMGKVRPEIIQFLKDPRSRTAGAYEGKEMILFLGASITTSIESWDGTVVFSVWLVQQSDNGLRAVSQFRYVIPSLLDQLDIPLDEMTQDIKRAAENRLTLTGGRIGTDPTLPMLVTDASELREFYTAVGAVYEGNNATVLPPPVPGEDDPPPPTLSANYGTG